MIGIVVVVGILAVQIGVVIGDCSSGIRISRGIIVYNLTSISIYTVF